MSMSYQELLKATKGDIEIIRKQPECFNRTPLSEIELECLRSHLDTLYDNRVQRAFAYRIYMKAEDLVEDLSNIS